MEDLSLEERGTPGGAQIAQFGPPPQNQQLPPQMFTTAAQLLDLTDKKLMVCLRDGKKLIGVLRSWDQFGNIVLQSTVERLFVSPPIDPSSSSKSPELGLYADIPRGIYLVRGENVLLLGEIDLDKDDEVPPGFTLADGVLVQTLLKERKSKEAKRDKAKSKKLAELGFEGENAGDALV